MGKKVIETSDGLKLVNSKTNKLAGSVSTVGKKAPTASRDSNSIVKSPSKITLYHGTAVALKPGTLILPPKKREEPTIMYAGTSYEEESWPSINFRGLSKPHLVYATEDIEDAKYFALVAATNDDFKKAYVYEVEALDKTAIKQIYPSNKRGVKRLEHQSEEGFRVIRLVASKTPTVKEITDIPAELKKFFDAPWK